MCDALPVMKARKPDLRSLVNDVAKERHSSLYVAMAENHAALSDAFTKRRPNWKELIVGFADLGLTDAGGNTASVRTAQQTWYRVCREKLNQRSAKATFPAPRLPPPFPPIKPGEMAPGVRPASEQPEPEPVRPRFAPATLRGHTSSAVPALPPPAPVPTQPARQDASQVIANLLGRTLHQKDPE